MIMISIMFRTRSKIGMIWEMLRSGAAVLTPGEQFCSQGVLADGLSVSEAGVTCLADRYLQSNACSSYRTLLLTTFFLKGMIQDDTEPAAKDQTLNTRDRTLKLYLTVHA